jgi:hypothetical protein
MTYLQCTFRFLLFRSYYIYHTNWVHSIKIKIIIIIGGLVFVVVIVQFRIIVRQETVGRPRTGRGSWKPFVRWPSFRCRAPILLPGSAGSGHTTADALAVSSFASFTATRSVSTRKSISERHMGRMRSQGDPPHPSPSSMCRGLSLAAPMVGGTDTATP